ncbi:MAG: hypothetical protein QHJ73_12695, partial [Armatimonadota bacterium]|nr:hypothetical protein [Armatimonadota bacterium]
RRYPPPIPAEAGSTFSCRPVRATRAFWALMAAMVCAGGCEAGMSFWGSNFAEEEFGATSRGGAGTVALFGGFMALGRVGSGVLVTRVSPLRLMLASAAACGVATAGLGVAQSLTAAWFLFSLGGLFVACFWPTLLAVGAGQVGVRSSADFGLLAAAGITGCMLFPWGIGVIADSAGMRAGVLLLPVSMLLEALLLAALGIWSARRAAGPPPAA